MPDGWTLVRPSTATTPQAQASAPADNGWTMVRPAKTAARPSAAAPAYTGDVQEEMLASNMGQHILGPFAGVSKGLTDTVGDAAVGFVKSAGNTAATLGSLVHKIPGVSATMDYVYGDGTDNLSQRSFQAAKEATAPTTTAQRVGGGIEQAAEFLVPGAAGEKTAAAIAAKAAPYFSNAPRLVQAAVKMAPAAVNEAAKAAAVAAAQGGDPATAAAFGAAGPATGAAVSGVGRYAAERAEKLVLSAVKPTVASLRKIAGASATGLDVQANKLARFILDTGATTADKARTILTNAEQELQRVLSLKNAPTDAAERSIRYLTALEKSAAKQGLPAADVATIRNAAAEVLEGAMGKDVVTMVPGPHPTLVGPNGQPITVMHPKTTRVVRDDVMADEALERARANSRWDTRKQWGEQKGAQMEASKAVERAQRDAVKAAVPEAAPLLRTQGQALTAIQALDRMGQRTGNRDALSLPGAVVAAGEIAGGKVPFLGMAAQWLRNNQMKAGVWADKLAKAIEKQDVEQVSLILTRLGAGASSQATQPARRP